MINIIFSIGIILTTTLIGYVFAQSYEQRIRMLHHFIFSIKIMETDMSYKKSYLLDILIRLSETKDRVVSNFFKGIYSEMHNNPGMDFETLWIKNADLFLKDTPFTNEDMKIIKELGKNLGKIDFINQEKLFQYIHKRLEIQLKEAEEQRDKKSRVYKNLGVAIGITIVVILI